MRRKKGWRFIQDSFSMDEGSHPMCVCARYVEVIDRSIVNRFVHVPTLPRFVRTVYILICGQNGANLAGQSVYASKCAEAVVLVF